MGYPLFVLLSFLCACLFKFVIDSCAVNCHLCCGSHPGQTAMPMEGTCPSPEPMNCIYLSGTAPAGHIPRGGMSRVCGAPTPLLQGHTGGTSQPAEQSPTQYPAVTHCLQVTLAEVTAQPRTVLALCLKVTRSRACTCSLLVTSHL